jgi:predicted PurR-regulated permease PerM
MQESPRPQVTLKTVFTACFAVLAVYGLIVFTVRTAVALTLSLSALVIAVALHHAVDLLTNRGVPRRSAIAATVLGGLFALLALGFTVVPPAISQLKDFTRDAPSFVAKARSSTWFKSIDDRVHVSDRVQELERQAPRMLEGAAAPLLTVVGGVVSGVATVVTVAVLAIFMLIFGPALVKALLSEALPEHRPLYSSVLNKIYRSIGGYLAGLILICSINALLTTFFLAIMGVPFFLPLGILSGSSSLIPYAGPAAAGAVISLIAGASGGLWQGLGCAIFFVVYGQIEGNILGPLIFRRTVHVNPLVVTLSILFLGELAGVFGAVLAVPVAAATQIVLRELLRARRERLHMSPFPFDRPSIPVSAPPSGKPPTAVDHGIG